MGKANAWIGLVSGAAASFDKMAAVGEPTPPDQQPPTDLRYFFSQLEDLDTEQRKEVQEYFARLHLGENPSVQEHRRTVDKFQCRWQSMSSMVSVSSLGLGIALGP